MNKNLSTIQVAGILILGVLFFWSLICKDIPRQESYMSDEEAEAYQQVMESRP